MKECCIPESKTHRNRNEKIQLPLIGCMKCHLFVFSPNMPPQMKQFLCDCQMCIQFRFDDCEKKLLSNISKEDRRTEEDMEDECCEMDDIN